MNFTVGFHIPIPLDKSAICVAHVHHNFHFQHTQVPVVLSVFDINLIALHRQNLREIANAFVFTEPLHSDIPQR